MPTYLVLDYHSGLIRSIRLVLRLTVPPGGRYTLHTCSSAPRKPRRAPESGFRRPELAGSVVCVRSALKKTANPSIKQPADLPPAGFFLPASVRWTGPMG